MWLARALVQSEDRADDGADADEIIVEEAHVTREALVEFYEEHDPSKLGNVDQIISMFGNGTELVKALEEKYGVRPSVDSAPQHSVSNGLQGVEAEIETVEPERIISDETDLEANVRELNAKLVSSMQRNQQGWRS